MRIRWPPPAAITIAIHVASLAILALVAFRRGNHSLFLRWDGHFQLSAAKTHFDWVPFGASLPLNFLQGVGDLAFPTLYRLIPAFVIGHVTGGDPVRQPITLAVLALELFVATLILGHALRFTLRASLVGGWLACVLFMPFFIPPPTYIRVWGNPPLVEAMAITAAVVALALHAARGGWRQAWGLGACGFVLLAYLAVTQAAGIVMALPTMVFFLVVAALTAPSRAGAVRVLAVGASVALLFVAVFGRYFYGLFGFSVAAYFWPEFVPITVTPAHASFFFHPTEEGGAFGRAYFWVAIAAAVLACILRGDPGQKRFAAGYLVFLGGLWAAVWAIASLFDGIWRGPPAAYLDMMAIPAQALFAASVVDRVLEMLFRGLFRDWVGELAARGRVLAVVPWVLLAAKPEVTNAEWRWPPRTTALIDHLRADIALAPGKAYRGRMVNLAGGHDPKAESPFYPAYAWDGVVRATYANDHRYMGPWYFNIPTLNLSNQFQSPFFNLVNMRLLNRPHVKNARPQTQTTEFEPRILRSLGVSWVFDDRPREGPGVTLVERMEGPGGRVMHLHRLAGANTGDWSPTQVLVATDAKEAIRRLADPAVDLRTTAIAFEPVPGPLAPARRARMTVHAGSFSVEAEADGNSLLLLPVEFSHCYELIEGGAGAKGIRLVRLNVNLTGMLFKDSANVRIRYRYGPLANPGCRLEDWNDAERVRLGETAGWWPADAN